MDDGTGLYEYRLLADTEAMTAIEAAVGPLAAPCPVEGEPDRRPSSQRRADALLAVLRRGVASAEGVGTTTKAQLVVSMSLADLTSGSYAGTVVGSTQDGTLLGPETVRRLACDARLVPAVLGSRGELLDLGRAVRLFSEGQTRALWLRDRGCTFPGCSVPASWSDAHHLRHWADGGSTDLANGALLCGRHHDRVHARGYHGEVTNEEVAWDVTPGSYDHWLRREEAPAGYQRAGPNLGKGTGAPPVREFDVWGQRATAPVEPSPPAWRP